VHPIHFVDPSLISSPGIQGSTAIRTISLLRSTASAFLPHFHLHIQQRSWKFQPWPPLQHAPPPPWQARACSRRATSSHAMSTLARLALPCASLLASPQPTAASGEYSAFGLLTICRYLILSHSAGGIFVKPSRIWHFELSFSVSTQKSWTCWVRFYDSTLSSYARQRSYHNNVSNSTL
jgi:hypothetical protein